MLKKIIGASKIFILKHKIISLLMIVGLVIAGYYGYKSVNNTTEETRYILASAVKGMITTSISGTGQIESADSKDIKTETSGKVTYINIQKDKEIKAGTLLAQIDSRDQQKAVQSAENDLADANLSLTDIEGDAKDALDSAYDEGLDALTATFKDLLSMKSDLDTMFLDSSYNGNDSDIDYYLKFVSFYNTVSADMSFWNTSAEQKYTDLQKNLDLAEETGWTINKSSNASKIEGAVIENYNSTRDFLDLIRQTSNLVQRYQKLSDAKSLTTPIQTSTTTTQLATLSSDVTTLAEDVSSLSAAKSNIATKKETFSKVGTDIQSQNLDIQQYKNALADAKEDLAKCYIYALLDGVISEADSTIKIGDTVSSGTVLGSIITKSKIAKITLSESDIANVKVGNKATLIFDAIEDLAMTGRVVEVDSTGTTSSRVVSYGFEIALDTDNDSVKPGMSVSATIITDSKSDVLTIPTTALKSNDDGTYYVQILEKTYDLTDKTNSIKGVASETAPGTKTVTIGLTDDTNTEITGGLSEGDQIVIRISKNTSATNSSSTKTTTNSILNTGGFGGGGAPPGM